MAVGVSNPERTSLTCGCLSVSVLVVVFKLPERGSTIEFRGGLGVVVPSLLEGEEHGQGIRRKVSD